LKPLFSYNDPGYTLGGPVYIPKLFERAKHTVLLFQPGMTEAIGAEQAQPPP
jgi:hypothetical protein